MFSAPLTQTTFLCRANQKHGKRYDYSLSVYKNAHKKVKIICKDHGVFEQTPDDHCLTGKHGCPSCSGNKRETTGGFIKKASQIHNNKYDYSLVEYKNNSTKVKVICNEHGVYNVSPANHNLRRSGCPTCKRSRLKGRYEKEYFLRNPGEIEKPAILYLVMFTDKYKNRFLKVGVTVRTTQKRFHGYYKDFTIKKVVEKNTTLFEAHKIEQNLLEMFKKYRYFPGKEFNGFTECLKYSPRILKKVTNVLTSNKIRNIYELRSTPILL